MFPRHSEPQVALGITPTWYLLVFEFLLPYPKQKVLHNVSYLIAVTCTCSTANSRKKKFLYLEFKSFLVTFMLFSHLLSLQKAGSTIHDSHKNKRIIDKL